jgi:nucleotide-binding universal stress UspA family protein
MKANTKTTSAGINASANPLARRRLHKHLKLLVPLDDGQPSEWALHVAGGLAERTSGYVRLLHVMQPVAVPINELTYLAQEIDEKAAQRCTMLLKSAQLSLPRSVRSDLVLRDGVPVDEILHAAEEWGADMIVMGTRGRARITELIMGSTADGVVRKSKCPVICISHDPHYPLGRYQRGRRRWRARKRSSPLPGTSHASMGPAPAPFAPADARQGCEQPAEASHGAR